MRDRLIELGFDKWLSKLEIAPYAVIFWDIPLFIQMSYIQKCLREEHNIHININCIENQGIYKSSICFITLGIYSNINEIGTYEEALEAGLKKALELIPVS